MDDMDEPENATCATDGSCGCAHSLGCTLDDDLGARLDAFRALFARGLRRRASEPGRAEWGFAWSAALAADARSFATAERACCSFFTFEIALHGDELRWIATAPPERHATLALLDEVAAESRAPTGTRRT